MSIAARPMIQPRVYVVQEDPRKNVVGALQWGSLEAVLEAREEATPLNIPAIITKIKYQLRYFREEDYLVLLGSPVAIGIACAFAAEQCGGRFNVLKWDPQEKRYWPAVIDLKQGE